MKPLLNAVFTGVFAQNWSLFAPNPVAQDYVLLIQPLSTNQVSDIQPSRWYNLSSSLWDRFHSNRFSAYDRLARSQTNALKTLISGDSRLFTYREACNKGDSAACKIVQLTLEDIRKTQRNKIARIGSAFCNAIGASDSNKYHYFACRLRIISFPLWSERNTGTKSIMDVDLGLFDINKDVAAFDVFR